MPKIKFKKAFDALPAVVQAEIRRLEKEVQDQENTGQFNTVHHEALRNFREALASTPETHSEQGEVDNG